MTLCGWVKSVQQIQRKYDVTVLLVNTVFTLLDF